MKFIWSIVHSQVWWCTCIPAPMRTRKFTLFSTTWEFKASMSQVKWSQPHPHPKKENFKFKSDSFKRKWCPFYVSMCAEMYFKTSEARGLNGPRGHSRNSYHPQEHKLLSNERLHLSSDQNNQPLTAPGARHRCTSEQHVPFSRFQVISCIAQQSWF